MNERQLKILSYLKNRGEVRNRELLSVLGGCTNMTLWRDLSLLENEGKIKRGRGTSMLVGYEAAGSEERFSSRIKQNMSGKEELAEIAYPLVLQNHSYYMDAGSTVFSLVKRLDKGGRLYRYYKRGEYCRGDYQTRKQQYNSSRGAGK